MKKLYKIISLSVVLIMFVNIYVFADININNNIKGALLGDLDTKEIIYEYNIDEKLSIASITKLMTYLLMMEDVDKGKISLEDNVVISQESANTEGSRFGLLKGETIKLSTLAKGMLVVSGNDCASAIAIYVGGTEENFVKMMNDKAKELNLLSANFINPHGLPIDSYEDEQNYISISDLYKLVCYILEKYPDILEITKLEELDIPSRNLKKEATNPILKMMENADGLKTGYTDKAGLCLVSTIPVYGQDKDFRLISIIMGAQTHEERADKSKELLTYGIKNYSFKNLVNMDDAIDKIYMKSSKTGKIDIYAAENFDKLVKNTDVIQVEIEYSKKVSPPFEKGQKIGTINISINEQEVKRIDAIVNENIKKANIFVRIYRFISGIFS